MKSPKRFFPCLAAALALVASTATLPGCAKGPGLTVQASHACGTVIAIVTYDGTTATMTTSQDLPDKLIQLSVKCKDTVQWVSPDGLVYVDTWSPDLPFDEKPKHDKKVLKSGAAKKKGTFDYTVWLAPTGQPPDTRIKVDPRIEVME